MCKNKIFGYHISENDGKRDSNKSFNKNSWFWKFVPKKSEYVSIEVYISNPKTLYKLQNLAKKKLDKY